MALRQRQAASRIQRLDHRSAHTRHGRQNFLLRRRKSSQVIPEKISTERKAEKQIGEEKSAVTALRRFRPPLRAAVSLENGQPVRVVCAKVKEVNGDVLWRAGPWRSSGDWWEHTAWSRDEWDIALQFANAIGLYRLVHDLLGGSWFVEGTYD